MIDERAREALESAWLAITDRGVTGPVDTAAARHRLLEAIEMLAEHAMHDDGGPETIYLTLAALDVHCLRHVAATAIVELSDAGWSPPVSPPGGEAS